jgi:hypothetical protein
MSGARRAYLGSASAKPTQTTQVRFKQHTHNLTTTVVLVQNTHLQARMRQRNICVLNGRRDALFLGYNINSKDLILKRNAELALN